MKAAWKSLASDCWEAIFSYLGDEDLKAVSLTCKDFLVYSNPLKKSLKVVHPQISMLSRHLNRFGHLKTIDLLEFQGNIDEAIVEIACSGIQLEALHAYFPKPKYLFSEFCLSELGSKLKACSFGGDIDVVEIANKYPNLEQLRFRSYSEIHRGSGLRLLASKLRLLKKIHVPLCCVSDQFIVALSINCVFLKDVSITRTWDDHGGVTESTVAQLLQNRPNLEALLIDCIVQDDSVSLVTIEDSISYAKALTSFVVGGMSNTDKVLRAIAKAKLRLNNLGLIACSDLTVSGLLLVLSNHLTKLRIEYARLTDQDMKLLLKGDVGKLTQIGICSIYITRVTLFLLLTKCPSLVDIRMRCAMLDGPVPFSKNSKIQSLCLKTCSRINGKLAKQLGRLLPNLKVIDLSGCHGVTTKNIQAILKRCKHLTELNLSGFQEAKMIEESDDSEFPKLMNLEVLKLSDSMINDEGLAVIAKKCPRLVSLDLDWCKGITKEGVKQVVENINDQGLAAIAKRCPKLVSLRLINCRYITTEGIKQVVRNIKTLTRLNLVIGDGCFKCPGHLLEWMLSTGNLASLNKIFIVRTDFNEEQRDQFLHRGCLLLNETDFLLGRSYDN